MERVMRSGLAVLLSSLLFLAGCGGGNGAQTTGGGQTTTVYLAGWGPTPSGDVADEWQLAPGSSTPTVAALSMPSSGTTASEACGTIAVSGSDVYVAGYAWNSVRVENYTAAYWVNGTATVLPLPSGAAGSSEACGVVVSGSDVYVAGNVPTTLASAAAYWKDGT